MVDRCSDPDKTVKDALKLDKGKVTVIYAAMTLALCNQEKHANQMLLDLEKHYPARHPGSGVIRAAVPRLAGSQGR
jgi:hypothetical protein